MAEDNSWVFDSLVCFLHGPIWNAPLQTFIEEKSLIFDPNIQPDESNPEYTKIHDEYKNLVDFMLGSFMEEMQITPEQFEIACLEGRNQKGESSFNFHQGLFQQIWAANDIKMFIRMMTQRNVEIQLQALDIIERRQQSMSSEKDDSQEDQLKEETLEGFPEAEELIAKSVEKDFATPEASVTPDEPEVADKFERLNIFFEHQKIDPEDIQSRQEYLRQQRDKIIAIKKKTRTKQLNDSTEKSDRPSSAQVAQKILDGNSEEVLGSAGNSERNTASMQLRKTLARRLRTEVVEQQS
ncbi:cilia- and flagella-associated protein 36 [Episyrphus balteatus]|uniref:cilia- and flagella-associated protein 36 n=1 Tax=Episyrphus balteatus TaxID=286459 RepID=UPI002485A634|nr:cilia- and flagella-associated protein 36 [Episyrphus balteatus]